jgi:hypothetical protein
MQEVQVPILPPIPFAPFDLNSLEGPTSITGVLDVHIDLEGSGGKLNTLQGTCAFGFLGIDAQSLKEVLVYEVAVGALYRDDPTQLAEFWDLPANKDAWKRILVARRDRIEVANEIQQIVGRLKALGWTIHIYARPVGYDFRELTTFFESLGVAHLETDVRFWKGQLGAHQILSQIVCGFPILGDVEPPNRSMVSPFGFGGASQVTDINQVIYGMCLALGFRRVNFNDVMKSVIGRSTLAHGGLQDARDQAKTWYAIKANLAAGTLTQFFNGIPAVK